MHPATRQTVIETVASTHDTSLANRRRAAQFVVRNKWHATRGHHSAHAVALRALSARYRHGCDNGRYDERLQRLRHAERRGFGASPVSVCDVNFGHADELRRREALCTRRGSAHEKTYFKYPRFVPLYVGG